MNSRRSFFRSVASLAATIALAPQIAFGQKLQLDQEAEDYSEYTCVIKPMPENYTLKSETWEIDFTDVAPAGICIIENFSASFDEETQTWITE